MEINKLVEVAHKNAVVHGFWDDWEYIRELNETVGIDDHVDDIQNSLISKRLMLIVGEVSEAMEGLRKNDKANFKEELADIIIRLADLCGGLNIDLATEINKKMVINKDRPYKHGKSF